MPSTFFLYHSWLIPVALSTKLTLHVLISPFSYYNNSLLTKYYIPSICVSLSPLSLPPPWPVLSPLSPPRMFPPSWSPKPPPTARPAPLLYAQSILIKSIKSFQYTNSQNQEITTSNGLPYTVTRPMITSTITHCNKWYVIYTIPPNINHN